MQDPTSHDSTSHDSTSDLDLSGLPCAVERVEAPISDFGLFHVQRRPHMATTPEGIEAVVALVRAAYSRGQPLRTRGGGHALNGSSVPSTDELLLRTKALDHYHFEREGTIVVGAGAPMWDVRDLCAEHGYYVPVVNNGSAGPTVGGLVAAGGFGPDSERFGGLWDNVRALTIVTGKGELRHVPRSDALFPWLFGSGGQLGIVVEAELELLRLDDVPPMPERADDGTSHPPAPPPLRPARAFRSPVGLQGRVPRVSDVGVPPIPGHAPPRGNSQDTSWRRTGAVEHDKLSYWVTILCPPQREAEARVHLSTLERHFHNRLEYLPLFRYRMVHRGMVAPLVYPRAEDFVALFHWGKLDIASEEGRRVASELEHAFVELILREGYQRYHQTELVGETMDFARYYGPEVYGALQRLRAELDPADILCRGGLGLSQRRPIQAIDEVP